MTLKVKLKPSKAFAVNMITISSNGHICSDLIPDPKNPGTDP